MKTFSLIAMLLVAALTLSACGSNTCPGGYADPNWCKQVPQGGDGGGDHS